MRFNSMMSDESFLNAVSLFPPQPRSISSTTSLVSRI
jgi:hypothetical protein